MYLSPDRIVPFSTIETISAEKNEITISATYEKNLNSSGSIATLVTLKKVFTDPVTAPNFETNPRMTKSK